MLRIVTIHTLILYCLIFLSFIGPGVLASFGYEMGINASSNYTKIHPLTYLLQGLLIIKLLTLDSKFIYNLSSIKASKYYLITIVVLLFYLVISNSAQAISFIIDTLLTPVLFFLYAKTLNENVQDKALGFALKMILLNSIIAIIERILSINLFPITYSFGEVFRSTSLLGHPLNNALITLSFILFILLSQMKTAKKNIYLFILFFALICYGARGCIYVAVLAIFIFYVFPLFFSSNKYYKNSSKLGASILLVLIFSALAYLTVYTSFGERLMEVSFFDDSASVRVQASDLIDIDSIYEYLWTRPQSEIDILSNAAGIEIIENYLIIWVLKFGLIFTIILLGFLVLFLVLHNRVCNKKISLMVTLLFFAAAATNNSLATTTTALSIFVMIFVFPNKRHKFIY